MLHYGDEVSDVFGCRVSFDPAHKGFRDPAFSVVGVNGYEFDHPVVIAENVEQFTAVVVFGALHLLEADVELSGRNSTAIYFGEVK